MRKRFLEKNKSKGRFRLRGLKSVAKWRVVKSVLPADAQRRQAAAHALQKEVRAVLEVVVADRCFAGGEEHGREVQSVHHTP